MIFHVLQTAQKISAAFSRPTSTSKLVRRAESFQHSRSVGDFEPFFRQKQAKNEPALTKFSRISENQTKSGLNPMLSKAKSMEFIKAKLMSSKSSLSPRQQHQQQQHSPAPSSNSSGEMPFQNYRREMNGGRMDEQRVGSLFLNTIIQNFNFKFTFFLFNFYHTIFLFVSRNIWNLITLLLLKQKVAGKMCISNFRQYCR